MISLKDKKTFMSFMVFMLVTSFMSFMVISINASPEHKRTPFMLFMCQPCWFEANINDINGITNNSAFSLGNHKRAKMMAFMVPQRLPAQVPDMSGNLAISGLILNSNHY
jgi:hypothetical protein